METALLYIVISSGLYYLLSRAFITYWLWSRYPIWLEHFMLCAACTGTWLGAGAAAAIGVPLDLPLLGLPGASPWAIIAGAFVGMVGTPILSWIMIRTLADLATTDEDEDEHANVTPISPRRK